MKKIVFTFISFLITLSAVHAQKGINYSHLYGAGAGLHMFIDSAAKNVYYSMIFPNQPNTAFNYLSEVDSVAIRINFRKKDSVQNYRYTVLADDKPIVVNNPIHKTELDNITWKDDDFKDEILRAKTLGAFPIKGKTITVLTYSIEKPLNVYKSVFYGKPIPKAKIRFLSKRFVTDKGVDYSRIIDPKEVTNLTFTEKDNELTVIKDVSEIDYLYYISIKDKQTDQIIFESKVWEYGGTIDESHRLLPYVRMDNSVFKKSGEYEIIIQPLIDWKNCLDCDMSVPDIEKYTSRYTLSITLENESYSQKDVWTYIGLACSTLGVLSGLIMVYIKRKNAKKLAREQQQKNIAKLQLSTIRSQLNPHFMFNALSGIQNLMNKNEIDNANKYLAKFARLTRTILDDKELISLSQEKKLLDDYLQMEQLRFGFGYEIKHYEDLDLDNIEIPSMLLQPFVENAVKHGVAPKGTVGIIIIWFIKQGNDLLLTVADNGNGFDTAKETKGLGLLLSKNRIALLNSIYKENHFNLAIQSNSDGTRISITLTEWL